MLGPVTRVLCGSVAAAARLEVGWPVPRAGIAVCAAVCANAASNAWNQAFDADIDRVNKPERPIPSGRASVPQAMRLGHLFAGLGLLAGATHAWQEKTDLDGTVGMQRLALNFVRARLERDDPPR